MARSWELLLPLTSIWSVVKETYTPFGKSKSLYPFTDFERSLGCRWCSTLHQTNTILVMRSSEPIQCCQRSADGHFSLQVGLLPGLLLLIRLVSVLNFWQRKLTEDDSVGSLATSKSTSNQSSQSPTKASKIVIFVVKRLTSCAPFVMFLSITATHPRTSPSKCLASSCTMTQVFVDWQERTGRNLAPR